MAKRRSSAKLSRKTTPTRRKPASRTTRRTSRPVARRTRRKSFIYKLAGIRLRPSYCLLVFGGFLLFWQLVIARQDTNLASYLPGSLAGASGLLLIVAGLVFLGMEAAGLREADNSVVTPAPRRRTSARRAKRPEVEEVQDDS